MSKHFFGKNSNSAAKERSYPITYYPSRGPNASIFFAAAQPAIPGENLIRAKVIQNWVKSLKNQFEHPSNWPKFEFQAIFPLSRDSLQDRRKRNPFGIQLINPICA